MPECGTINLSIIRERNGSAGIDGIGRRHQRR